MDLEELQEVKALKMKPSEKPVSELKDSSYGFLCKIYKNEGKMNCFICKSSDTYDLILHNGIMTAIYYQKRQKPLSRKCYRVTFVLGWVYDIIADPILKLCSVLRNKRGEISC